MTFPRDAELLRRVLDSRLLDVHTAMPCRVEAFDAVAQTVDVQPMVKNVIADPDGTEREESYPLIRNVPVIYPRSGAFVVAFPLVQGDFVTVVFNEWSIDYFVEKGTEVHPVDLQRHAYSGAVAFPGGPFPASTPVAETIDGMIIGHDGGAVLRIKDDGTIALGATAATKQPIALADDVKAELDALRNTVNAFIILFNAHFHITTATVGPSPTPGVIAPPASPATAPAVVTEMGSSVAEVEV